MRARNYFLFGIAVLVGLAVTMGFLISNREHAFQGSLIEAPTPAPDFLLTDQDGNPFRLSEQEGNAVLAFFGYTHCPDVCPVTLSDFKRIRAELGAKSKQVRFVFITTDPQRDSPGEIKKYLSNFDPAIVGLSGTEQELQQVWSDYGVYQEKVSQQGQENYLVDHTARVYLVDPRGNLRVTYTFGTESRAIAADVAYLLGEN